LSGIEYSDTAIYDEMYGYIPLTKAELEVVNHPYFQRLNQIRQLGAAYRVFPGAQHTRFSHSLGVMYIMDRMVTVPAIQGKIPLKERQKLRMAALLHDIGHYPLSHLTETVMIENQGIKHEPFGAYVIANSTLTPILIKNGFDPKELGQIITGQHANTLFNQLMSSDLDADRLDYLMRDSVHTGVAYGKFDLNRLIHTLVLDTQEKLCVDKSGMHAAEGYVISRYLMWAVVYTHRVINAFEEIITKIYQQEIGSLLPTFQDIKQMAKDNEQLFAAFDDNYLLDAISLGALSKEPVAELCQMLKSRTVLSVAQQAQGMSQNGKSDLAYFILDQYFDKDKLELLSKKSGVPIEWICHNSSRTKLPNLKPIVEITTEEVEERQKETSRSLHILFEDKVSKPLVTVDNSIVAYLNNMSLDTVRIYTKEIYKNQLKAELDKEISTAKEKKK
jgi:uncharacterized protein